MRYGTLLILAAMSAPAAAQDFGTAWVDRITNEVQDDRPPLQEVPVSLQAAGGLLYYYDDNIYLEKSGREDSSSVLVPFAQARLDYSEPRFQAAADVLLARKEYLQERDESGHDERLFGRLRYADGAIDLQGVAIFQHLSDPTDAIFSERIRRTVTNLLPLVVVHLTEQLSVEARANIQLTRFLDKDFDHNDNDMVRASGALVYEAWEGVSLVGEGGYISIRYVEDDRSAPDVDGAFVRGGVRGEIAPTLHVTAMAGWSEAGTNRFPDGSVHTTSSADVAAHVRWEATETIIVHAGYDRLFTFGLGGDAFNLINRFKGIVEYDVTDQVSLRGRAQWERADAMVGSGLHATYTALTGSAAYAPLEFLLLETGVTWRTGDEDRDGFARDFDYDNTILWAGGSLRY